MKEDDVNDTRREFDGALNKDIWCTDFQFVKKLIIREIGTKEHGCVKVDCFA